MMLRIGLTGGIAMGKSTVATMFADEGVAVFDADDAVHALYSGKAAPLIEAAFPGTTGNGVVDRKKLGAVIAVDPSVIERLEAIVHPLVWEAEAAFIAAATRAGRRIAVLDIPLLFETGADRRMDVVVVVSAPPEVQRQRLEQRGMPAAEVAPLIARQTPDAEKRARAHFVIDTSGPFEATRGQVRGILRALAAEAAVR